MSHIPQFSTNQIAVDVNAVSQEEDLFVDSLQEIIGPDGHFRGESGGHMFFGVPIEGGIDFALSSIQEGADQVGEVSGILGQSVQSGYADYGFTGGECQALYNAYADPQPGEGSWSYGYGKTIHVPDWDF